MYCLLYALIGVPLNAILIGAMASVFGSQASRFKKMIWEDLHFQPKARVVFLEATTLFLIFFAVFLPIPAVLFSYLENGDTGLTFSEGDWSFLNSLYYTFITLSTIGFGDMVPGELPAPALSS